MLIFCPNPTGTNHIDGSVQNRSNSSANALELLQPVLSHRHMLGKGQQQPCHHYSDVTMRTMASQITSLRIVYSTVYSGVDQRKHRSSASLAFVRGIHRWPMISPHKRPVTRKIFPFDNVIMILVRHTAKIDSICNYLSSDGDVTGRYISQPDVAWTQSPADEAVVSIVDFHCAVPASADGFMGTVSSAYNYIIAGVPDTMRHTDQPHDLPSHQETGAGLW